MAEKQISHAHHYLPVFLLKGFTGEDGKLWVYDKKSCRFWKRPASPKQVFWRYNQNTFKIGEEETDFVEEIYAKVDNDFSPIYSRILTTPGPVVLSADEMAQLVRFVAVSFYRVPINDDFAKDYIASRSPQDLGFRLFNKATNKNADEELYNLVINQPAFIESYRISKALLELAKFRKEIKDDDWTVAAPVQLKEFGIIGDNPVILKDIFKDDFVDQDCIMPISRHHVVYHQRGKRPISLPPAHKFTIDLFQYLQAGNYICGSDRSYMERIVAFVNKKDPKELIKTLKPEFFSVFYS